MNGISIDYPESWEVKSATEPWTGGQLSFDTPGADIIFDPAFGGGLYIAIVSQSYGDATADQWSNDSGEWLCPDGVDGAAGSWGIDGANANSVRCDPTYALVVTDETRGYAIQVVVPSAEPALADTYDKAWLLDLLETVDLRTGRRGGSIHRAARIVVAGPDAHAGGDGRGLDAHGGGDGRVADADARSLRFRRGLKDRSSRRLGYA